MSTTHEGIYNLVAMLKATGKKYDIDKIETAYEYARALHDGQFRASGEPYISHPIAVAEIVAGLELDTDSICAALLHDTVEDCSEKTNLKEIEKLFGQDVAMLVDGLTKIVTLKVEDKEEAHIETLRKMLLAMSKDVRVIFIKLCDRLHNMRTLDAKPDAKRRITALETMQVYAPLAHRLGMQKIKQELENLGLKYIDPIGYEEVRSNIEKKYGQSLHFIEDVRLMVDNKLVENNIKFTLEGRIKTAYSIYRKMYNQNKSFDEIFDFYALRIIVDTELDCYTALGLIHEMFNSVPGRFKDYISTPKPNMYRSLHTTVIGKYGIPFEVQIRTWEMHHIAEYGVAAHWKYKSGERSKEEIDKKLEWISKLLETEDETRDPEEFMQALKIDIFHDETFVFTPKGDVIALPQGATVIDFAYSIHSAVGHKMIGAKINGMIVPIDRVLQNGEIVEILTSSSSKGPSRDWLKIVTTSGAKNRIRQWFKKEKRADNIILGRSMIEGEIKKAGLVVNEAARTEAVENVAIRIGFSSAEDLYNTVGYGGIPISKVKNKIVDEVTKIISPAEPEPIVTEETMITAKPRKIRSNSGIIVDGESGCSVKYAKCCNPLPGDQVIGFITKGFGISIHKCDCPNVINGRNNPEYVDRWVSAAWDINDSEKRSLFEAHLQLRVDDRIGMLADISVALADMRVDILQINVQTSQGGSLVSLKVGCKNTDHYNSIVSRLRNIPGVYEVSRGFVK
ncbi:MAG: bifunctional (p)ppGpp synthetase/guanosine-3',5'-bis(diphosphate) 3'-pyrophosphohydrolase [Bacteroidales bacterium]|nr:bifunctional (p)ppGpp synthetase/guanosine-3',5'-bis(diphosphate) 3'-pyrophosphohydrolase [Bacteroidales bacterium]MBQ7873506.1 bifunctional (p)ppGpp synthetase/guanosine-3',5'-bis(diphosphate) 3'-pyrophosphohydrolase [Clostridia bacterium]